MFVRNGQKVGSILHKDTRKGIESTLASAKPKAAPSAEKKATPKTPKAEPLKDKEVSDV